MTKARNIADLLDANGDVKSGSLDNVPAVDLTNLSASNLTSGTIPDARITGLDATKLTGSIADARIPASAVSQHVTSYNDNSLVNDVSTLALRQATNENAIAYNTNSSFVDVFQDSSGIASLTTSERNASEYVNSSVQSVTVPSSWSNVDLSSFGSLTNSSSGTYDAIGTGNNSAIGNLGSGSYFQLTNTNANRYVTFEVGVSNLEWGANKKWEVLLATDEAQNNGFAIVGILGGENHTSSSNVDSGSIGIKLDTTTATNGSQISDGNSGLSIYCNTGYSTSNTIRGLHVNGDTSIAGTFAYSTGKGLNRFVYDGTANSGAGRLDFYFYTEGSTTENTVRLDGSENSRTLPTSGSPLFAIGHHNGANSDPYLQVWHKTGTASSTLNATGNFISNTITAPSSISSMGAIITYQDHAGTNALNTDIILQLSADNGSTYSTATLSAMPNFSSGIKMAKVNDLAVTAGTQLKYKISFANQSSGSKEARIRGVSLQY